MPLPKNQDIKEWKRKIGEKVRLAKKYNLQVIETPDLPGPSEKFPKIPAKGIYLVPPHGELIWKGEKTAIVKSRKYHVNEPLVLISDKKAYGVITVSEPIPITKKEFDSLRPKHRITEEEFKKWKWKGKQLYYYKIALIQKFVPPKRVKIPQGIQSFIRKVTFLSVIRKDVNPSDLNDKELILLHAKLHAMFKNKPKGWSYEDIVNLHTLVVQEMKKRGIKHINYDKLDEESAKFLRDRMELIKDAEHYDPSKLSDAVLLDDHRIVHAWWSSLQHGKILRHPNGKRITKEEVRHLHSLIVKELIKRGFKHHTPLVEELSLPERAKKITDQLKPATIIENFVTLIGSYITDKKNPNDIDILLRFDRTSGEFIERATKVRIAKMLDVDKDLHFTNDPEGPHDSYIPLFDLVLVPKTPKLVELSLASVQLFKPYLPMKPYHSAFYKVEDALAHMKGKEWSIEFKYNGFHAIAHKKGKEVKIYSEQLKDISLPFPTLRESIYKLAPDHDFIIDGEIVPYSNEGKALGRDPLMKFIGAVKSGKKLDDSNIKMHVFDITYFDKPLIDLPLKERQKYLSRLHYNERVERVKFKIVNNLNDAKKAILWAASLPGSEGAVIKDLNSPYVFDEKSSAWIKFRHLVDIHAVVLQKVPKKKGLFNYLIGVYVSEKDAKKLHPKYLVDFKGKKVLVLGHTFNTPEQVPEGSIIDVALEDVWRHTYRKEGVARYSIHKPRFRQRRPDLKDTSSIQDLEDIVTSIGEEVIED